ELVRRAQALGYTAIALTDECSLAGVVRAHVEAQACGMHLIVGAEMRLTLPPDEGGVPHARLVLLAQDRRGYANLWLWITLARRRAAKGAYRAHPGDLEGRAPTAPMLAGLPGCLVLLVPSTGQSPETVLDHARWLQRWVGDDDQGRPRAAIALE